MITLRGEYTDADIFIDDVEDSALQQIQDIIDSLAAQSRKVKIMPDVHTGNGICIGFTMQLGMLVSPNWIGVDIGCGMLSAKISTPTMTLPEIDTVIKDVIPTGFSIHTRPLLKTMNYASMQHAADNFIGLYNKRFHTSYKTPTYSEPWLLTRLKKIGIDEQKVWKSLGTLGGGNHFIELGVDEVGNHWLTIHSGSRNLGLTIAKYWSDIADGKQSSESADYVKCKADILANSDKSEISNKLFELKQEFNKHKGLLSGDDLMGYVFDMIFAQEYANLNRQTMLNQIRRVIKFDVIEQISTVHNYIDFADLIIRKGAISSYENELMIIPFNQKDGLLICEGKSNIDWNRSAPHGAGRIMSRTKAKELIKLDDVVESMKGVYSTSVCSGTIDESVFAYKNSKMIEDLIKPTATIIHRVKPILNVKDTGERDIRRKFKAKKI